MVQKVDGIRNQRRNAVIRRIHCSAKRVLRKRRPATAFRRVTIKNLRSGDGAGRVIILMNAQEAGIFQPFRKRSTIMEIASLLFAQGIRIRIGQRDILCTSQYRGNAVQSCKTVQLLYNGKVDTAFRCTSQGNGASILSPMPRVQHQNPFPDPCGCGIGCRNKKRKNQAERQNYTEHCA